MADSKLNLFLASGNTAVMTGFVPVPPITAPSDPHPGYFFFNTQTLLSYTWNNATTTWVAVGGSGTANGLTNVSILSNSLVITGGSPVISNGTVDIELTPIGVAGTYSLVTVANTGIVTSGTGILPLTNGGTGENISGLSAGQLLIGNSVSGGFDVHTLTAGSGVTVTNSNGAITIAATSGSGTVTNVAVTSHSLTVSGSPITSNGVIDIELSNSGVIAGSYPFVTVNSQGIVTAGTAAPLTYDHGGTGNIGPYTAGQILIGNAVSHGFDVKTISAGSNITVTNANGSITIAATGNGSVTSVGLTSSSLHVTGSPISSSGTIDIELVNSGVTAGSYPLVTVNSQGIVTAATASPLSYDHGGTGHVGPYTAGQILIGNTVSGGFDVNTLTAGSGITVTNANGAITLATANNGSVTNISVASNSLTVAGSPISSSGTIHVDIPNSGVAAGSYPYVTVNSQGIVTAGTASPLTYDHGGTGHVGPYTAGQILIGNAVTHGFDVNTLSAGSNITVTNANGNITIASTGGSSGGIGSVGISSTTLTVNNSPLTANGTISLELGVVPIANGGTGRGISSTSAGQLLIGNAVSGGFDLNTIAAGAGIGITNTNGEITITSMQQSVSTQSANAYTAQLTDARSFISFTNSTATTFTIPADGSVNWLNGTSISIEQASTGPVTVAGAAGVTVNYYSALAPTTAGQFAVAQVIRTTANAWTLFGTLQIA